MDPLVWKIVFDLGATGIALAAFGRVWLHARDGTKIFDDHEERMQILEAKAAQAETQLAEIIRANHYSLLADQRIETAIAKLDERLDGVQRRFERVLGKMGYPPSE